MKRAILALFLAGSVAGLGLANAQGAGDAAAGKRVFARCLSCHKVGPNAANGVGPELNGIIGETAGTGHADYAFSDAMKAAGAAGLTWTNENLAAFLKNPKEKVPDTKMTFPGLPKDEDVANVIAYLATFGPDGNPKQ